METTAYIALSRQMALRRQMDLIANNIANVTASGFKAEALIYEPVVSDAGGGQRLAFVQDVGVARDLRAGPMTQTGNPLDLAIQGPGYFAIETDHGTRYGRSGQFRLNESGELVTAAGDRVLDDGGAPVSLPVDAGPIALAADGTVSGAQGRGRPHRRSRVRRRAAPAQGGWRAVPGRPAARAGRTQPRGPGRARGLERAADPGDDRDDGDRARLSGRTAPARHPPRTAAARDRACARSVELSAAATGDLEEHAMRSLSIAATGMMAQQLNVEVISNNIANMTTAGYKRRRPEFQDLLYQNYRRIGASSSDVGTIVPTGVQVGLGVMPAAVYRIHEQGNMVATENPLDLAIQGTGYFVVEQPNGEIAYTRDGSFQLSPQGLLVTADGYTVSPGITVPEDAIQVTIDPTGLVQAKIAGQIDPVDLGQLETAIFPNQVGLEAIGNNLLIETPASGPAALGTPGSAGYGELQQAFIESSNVNPVSEITALITAQRAYDLNSKVITASDEMMATITQLR